MLYESNLLLIKKIIKPFAAYEPMEDLLQEAYFGLWVAVQRYESSKEVRFMTYAHFWIYTAVRNYIVKCGSTVRLPFNIREKLTNYSRAADKIRREQGREPSIAEIVAFTGIPDKEVRKLKTYAQGVGSLDTPLAEDGSLTLSDTIQGDSDPENEAIDKIYDEHSKAELWDIVERYADTRESNVILEIFLYGKNLAQIAREQGVTIERVRQLKEKGLRKLRRGKALRELREKFETAEAGIYRSGLSNYRQHNFVSVVEHIATKELEAEECYKRILEEIE
ncbi:MAG: sigma-70 family RNA polymerase sigma factor [Lachnospiraceae bacterium]|nr:sigma-70 family RNA polymerase sigma factor [Lachnospiraceae bacterium]